ncbi:MAG: VOC family protein [Mariprofundus sp.]|nr:VOC family protein [Mariprofundus sp.]
MKIAHIGLLVADLERAALFYEQILGLQRIHRPPLAFEGLWYGLDQGQQIHLMRLNNPYAHCEQPPHGGRDHHIAMQAHNFQALKTQLDQAGIPFTLSQSGRSALFCRDPDGNTIELIEA